MLKLSDVNTYYGRVQILYDISMEVKPGTVTCVLGRNGMGKTTLIHSIFNFVPPKSGHTYFKDEEITPLRPHQILDKGIALVPQGRRIFTTLTVFENLTIGERKRKDGPWTLPVMYKLFPILKERARVNASLLSGGEQQMLCIGRALMSNPQLILMDEPSEGLAPLVVREVGEIILQFKSQGLSTLLVEQNLDLAYAVGDYVYIIDGGRIVYESTIEELKNNEEVQTNYLFIKRE